MDEEFETHWIVFTKNGTVVAIRDGQQLHAMAAMCREVGVYEGVDISGDAFILRCSEVEACLQASPEGIRKLAELRAAKDKITKSFEWE